MVIVICHHGMLVKPALKGRAIGAVSGNILMITASVPFGLNMMVLINQNGITMGRVKNPAIC